MPAETRDDTIAPAADANAGNAPMSAATEEDTATDGPVAAREGAAPDGPVPPFVPDPARAGRLLRLRVLLKSMIAVAAVGVVFVFFSAFLSDDGEENTLPGLRVAIGDMRPGETRTLTWDGRAVLVHRRTPEQIARLERNAHRGALRDPESAKSEQPESMRGPLRSGSPEWFVAIGLGTDYGCPVGFLEAGGEAFAGAPWDGGFVDGCRGSRYDLGGRVYAGQYADRNLVVPPHTVDADGTLVLGR